MHYVIEFDTIDGTKNAVFGIQLVIVICIACERIGRVDWAWISIRSREPRDRAQKFLVT